MPPQIKQDLNRSGWETTDMPSVCERCLPENPYVQMIKDDYGAECKVCTRPFTLFKWKADRNARQKRTIICLTCARLKNCCQSCMLDLHFGLPITIRDQALKMIAPGPGSAVNREFYAQNNEREIEEGRGGLEAYEKTDEKAMELLKKLANSEQYSRKRRIDEDVEGKDMKALPPPESLQHGSTVGGATYSGEKRQRVSGNGSSRGGRGGAASKSTRPLQSQQQPPSEADWQPPQDRNIKSLFVLGVEDDLPEYSVREFFEKYGTLQSVVCSHRAHCAFINYQKRLSAENAADACRGKAIIRGCPLRVTWGRPKTLDTTDRDQRIANARAGREVAQPRKKALPGAESSTKAQPGAVSEGDELDGLAAMPPPGQDDVNYASLAGD
ncbi:MAG: hypothetical protein Q9162_004513 [Coniocarpon cinnabarinum]